jgi:hypothetical protein
MMRRKTFLFATTRFVFLAVTLAAIGLSSGCGDSPPTTVAPADATQDAGRQDKMKEFMSKKGAPGHSQAK